MKWIKRVLLTLVSVSMLLAVAYVPMVHWIGGAFDDLEHPPRFSAGAQQLIDAAFQGIDSTQLKDYHVHVIGLQTGPDGAWINPDLLSWRGLQRKIKGDVFMSAAGIETLASLSDDYIVRLLRLIERMPVRGEYQLLAFDFHHTDQGLADPAKSGFYVSNDYVFRLARSHPHILTAAVSVHPYRDDAVARLNHWAEQGVRFVKWLPNAHGIDPRDPRTDRYYEALISNNMVLLTHVGEEKAVEAAEDQVLGNPLAFRRALDKGVKVIMAHAASLGTNRDTDAGGREVRNFELFLRLMDEPDYAHNLFGEISAITQINRLPHALATLLLRTDLHSRLVNGSDYPLPAINVVISTRLLEYHGFIDASQRLWLNEIYRDNPLLFDFVVKRTLRHPQSGQRFKPGVFLSNPALEDR